MNLELQRQWAYVALSARAAPTQPLSPCPVMGPAFPYKMNFITGDVLANYEMTAKMWRETQHLPKWQFFA